MKRNGKKSKNLTRSGALALLGAKEEHRLERERRASTLRQALAARYRTTRGLPEGAKIDAEDAAVLTIAVSSLVEIEVTTDRMIAGRASSKSLANLAAARSEARRCLKSLGMIGDSGEAPPPAGPTLEELKAKYEPREVAS